jgi:hypothetical protein
MKTTEIERHSGREALLFLGSSHCGTVLMLTGFFTGAYVHVYGVPEFPQQTRASMV